jgi:hypothetical protein
VTGHFPDIGIIDRSDVAQLAVGIKEKHLLSFSIPAEQDCPM